jgi:hypothetical protein
MRDSTPLLLLAYRDPRLLPAISPGRSREASAGLDLGSGDDDQDDGHPGPVASSISNTTSGTRSMPAFRSVVSVLVRFVGRSFSTNSRPALRAAASGGRPRPAGASTARATEVASPGDAPEVQEVVLDRRRSIRRCRDQIGEVYKRPAVSVVDLRGSSAHEVEAGVAVSGRNRDSTHSLPSEPSDGVSGYGTLPMTKEPSRAHHSPTRSLVLLHP